jgi:hypothetical protein
MRYASAFDGNQSSKRRIAVNVGIADPLTGTLMNAVAHAISFMPQQVVMSDFFGVRPAFFGLIICVGMTLSIDQQVRIERLGFVIHQVRLSTGR